MLRNGLIAVDPLSIVSTVSTVNRKDQMLLVLFTKVFDDSEKYFEKVRPNFP